MAGMPEPKMCGLYGRRSVIFRSVVVASQWFSRRAWREVGLLFAAIGTVNATNYLFHVLSARILGPSSYGTLSALLSFFVWAATCATAIQLVIAGSVSSHASPETWPHLRTLRVFSFLGVLVGIVIVLAGPLIRDFLQLRSLVSALLLAAYPLPALLGAVGRGMLQGRLRFGLLATVTAGTSVLRLFLAIPLLVLGGGIESALAATLGAEVVGALAAVLLHRSSGSRTEEVALTNLLRSAAAAVTAMGGFWAIVSFDTVLARHYLNPHLSGFYAASAITARSLLFLPGAVALVVFPRLAALRGRPEAARDLRRHSLAAVGVISLMGLCLLLVFREPVIHLLFGDAYDPAVDVLLPLALAMVVLALGQLALHYNLALGLPTWPAVAVGLSFEASAIAYFHENGAQVAVGMLATACLFLVAVLHLSGRARSNTRHRSIRAAAAASVSAKDVP